MAIGIVQIRELNDRLMRMKELDGRGANSPCTTNT